MKIPSQLVLLGDALELDGTVWEWTWILKDKTKLYSNANGTRLFIITDKKLGTALKKNSNRDSKKAERLYSRFMEFEPNAKRLHGLKSEPTLKRTGSANYIIYRSDKFSGKQTRYIHEFKTRPAIWTDNPARPSVIVLSGGKIRVKAEGITG